MVLARGCSLLGTRPFVGDYLTKDLVSVEALRCFYLGNPALAVLQNQNYVSLGLSKALGFMCHVSTKLNMAIWRLS